MSPCTVTHGLVHTKEYTYYMYDVQCRLPYTTAAIHVAYMFAYDEYDVSICMQCVVSKCTYIHVCTAMYMYVLYV